MPLKILIQFAQAHPDFRIPELLSVAQIYGFDIILPQNPDVTRPFMIIEIQQEHHARLIAQRCILVKFVHHSFKVINSIKLSLNRSVHEFYASGSSYFDLHRLNQSQAHLWTPYKDSSWKFMVIGYNQSVPKARQREVVESFSYMALEGRIDLIQPELELWCFEECTQFVTPSQTRRAKCSRTKH